MAAYWAEHDHIHSMPTLGAQWCEIDLDTGFATQTLCDRPGSTNGCSMPSSTSPPPTRKNGGGDPRGRSPPLTAQTTPTLRHERCNITSTRGAMRSSLRGETCRIRSAEGSDMGSINGYSVLVTGGGSGIGEAAAAARRRRSQRDDLRTHRGEAHRCGRTHQDTLPTARPSPTWSPMSPMKIRSSPPWPRHRTDRPARRSFRLRRRLDGCRSPCHQRRRDDPLTMELNIGTFLCIKHGGTQMARQEGGGSIIGCSSAPAPIRSAASAPTGLRKPGLTTSAVSPPTRWASSVSGSTPSSPALSARSS